MGRYFMSPVSCMMIHNPATFAIGDSDEMLRAKDLLDEIKESIINAYEDKTGIRRTQLGHMMTAETWMNAKKAVELGFADGILYADTEPQAEDRVAQPLMFSRAAVTNSLLDKLPRTAKPTEPQTGVSIESLYKRLSLIAH